MALKLIVNNKNPRALSRDVDIVSRDNVHSEINLMRDVIKKLPRERFFLSYVFCDSHAGATYEIGVNPVPKFFKKLMQNVAEKITEIDGGHNGIYFTAGTWEQRGDTLGVMDPHWNSDEQEMPF